jgi:hypothetical protein
MEEHEATRSRKEKAMGKLEDVFVDRHLSSVDKRMPWSADRVYGKVMAAVRSAVRNLENEGKTSLSESRMNLSLRTGYSSSTDGIECGIRLESPKGPMSRVEFKVKIAGFAGLSKQLAWMALGEARFVERLASRMLEKIALAEYRYRYEHGLGLPEGLAAVKEARELNAAVGRSKTEHAERKSNSL